MTALKAEEVHRLVLDALPGRPFRAENGGWLLADVVAPVNAEPKLTVFCCLGSSTRRNTARFREGVTTDTRNCPETATKLPAGGHENCPLAVMRSARHESVCLAASRG